MSKTRVTGHLGELLQGRLGPQGPVVLITLPAPALSVTVTRTPGAFVLHQPQGTTIQREIFRRLCQALGVVPQGRWHLRVDMPIGAGAGASTATLLALAQLLRPDLAKERLASLCHSLEGASDPLHLDHPERVLWASRLGKAVAHLPKLPRLQVVGGFQAGCERTDPKVQDFPDIADLVTAWPQACENPQALADLVTTAAGRRMRQKGQDTSALENMARAHGALGWGIAHTGTARFFLLPPAAPKALTLRQKLHELGLRHLQHYEIGGI